MITESEVKSVFSRKKQIDSWFLSRYKAGIYRGCMHNCVYCDGRAEKYNVQGEFGKDVSVKSNLPSLLEKEMSQAKKRNLISGFLMPGSGVTDSYQPVEAEYGHTRKTLELCEKYHYPVHILTKSDLVVRDKDILRQINRDSRVIVSFSFSSADDRISSIFEPGVPSPSRRLEVISELKQEGIHCGLFLMPVIPFITDTGEKIEELMAKAQQAGVDYVIFGGMTLKPGRQKDHFLSVLNCHYPHLTADYIKIYGNNNPWGTPDFTAYRKSELNFAGSASKYKIPVRIPPHIYRPILNRKDTVSVILQHLDYLCRLKGVKNDYAKAAEMIADADIPGENTLFGQPLITGLSGPVSQVVNEILSTGTSVDYEKMIYE